MPNPSDHKRNKLKKRRANRMPTQRTVLSRRTSPTQSKTRSSRRAIQDHRLGILRKRRSSESFACAGASSPDLDFLHESQVPHYDLLLEKSQVQKYHYNRYFERLMQQAQPNEPQPRRCILRSDFQSLKRKERNKSIEAEVDMVSNVRWLRLISEVEKAINSRPFKPTRSPLATGAQPITTLTQIKPLQNPYFPFPIPPTRSSVSNKRPEKTTEFHEARTKSTNARVAVRSSEGDSARIQDEPDHRAPIRKSTLFQGDSNIRQSQELQLGRWDHLVQLERRAREASEEGMRKASLNSSAISSASIGFPLPPRKLSFLDRVRRPSTVTKDSKKPLLIGNPVPILSLQNSFSFNPDFAREFAFQNPGLTQIPKVPSPPAQESPRSSFVLPNVIPNFIDGNSGSPLVDSPEPPNTALREFTKMEECSPSPQFVTNIVRARGPRPCTFPIPASTNATSLACVGLKAEPRFLQQVPTTETVEPTTSKSSLPEVYPLRVIKNSMKNARMTEAKSIDKSFKESHLFEADHPALDSIHESKDEIESGSELKLPYLTESRKATTSAHNYQQNLAKYYGKEKPQAPYELTSNPANIDYIYSNISKSKVIQVSQSHIDHDLNKTSAIEPGGEKGQSSSEMQTMAGFWTNTEVSQKSGFVETKSHQGFRGTDCGRNTLLSRSPSISKGSQISAPFPLPVNSPVLEPIEHSSQHRLRHAVIEKPLCKPKREYGVRQKQVGHHGHDDKTRSELKSNGDNVKDPKPTDNLSEWHHEDKLSEPHRQGSPSGVEGEDYSESIKRVEEETLVVHPHIIGKQFGASINSEIREECRQPPSGKIQSGFQYPSNLDTSILNPSPHSTHDQIPGKESPFVSKIPVRLIFELPVKPEKAARTNDGMKVQKAWESLSQFKRWTGVDRPKVEGIVRIAGGRQFQNSPQIPIEVRR